MMIHLSLFGACFAGASAMQLVVDALGSFAAIDGTSGGSVLKVEHHIEGSTFHLAVHHGKGVERHTLEEFSLFGEGFRSFAADGSVTHLKPTFQTFRSAKVRVQLNHDGKLHGWLPLQGRLVKLQKHMSSDEVTASLLHNVLEEKPKKKKKHKPWVGKRKRCNLRKCGKDGKCRNFDLHPAEHLRCSKSDKLNCFKFAVDEGCIGPECEEENPTIATSDEDITDNYSKSTNLLQLDETWNGEKWWPGCFDEDSDLHEMKIGVLVDMKAKDRSFPGAYSYHNDTWQDEIAYQFNEANMIYTNQMNINLAVGFTISYASDDAAPSVFTNGHCDTWTQNSSANHLSGQLNEIVSFIEGGYDNGKDGGVAVASTHMFTGCNSWLGTGTSGSATVGLAWVGTLCDDRGYASGVNHINAGWTTFAHELGHNFKGSHSFEEGPGATGGIMDYGDGKIDGIYQFNTQYRKSEICNHLTATKAQCPSAFFKSSTAGTTTTVTTQTAADVTAAGANQCEVAEAHPLTYSECQAYATSNSLSFANQSSSNRPFGCYRHKNKDKLWYNTNTANKGWKNGMLVCQTVVGTTPATTTAAPTAAATTTTAAAPTATTAADCPTDLYGNCDDLCSSNLASVCPLSCPSPSTLACFDRHPQCPEFAADNWCTPYNTINGEPMTEFCCCSCTAAGFEEP